MTVRFGNVLGSTGSVVLTFKEQIAAGGPITITHPEMKRYFMTIPEAVQLVLQAAVLGKGEEVFVLDMGEPVKIVDLAKDLIRLSGLSEDNIEITYIGCRPGEKLYEELFAEGEVYVRTIHEKLFLASQDSSKFPSNLNGAIDSLELAAQNNDRAEIVRILKKLIPEYQPYQVEPS
jgi:FlaA1/EpsC-like NDP-sugar epimerase